jgi:DNA primase large subunit
VPQKHSSSILDSPRDRHRISFVAEDVAPYLSAFPTCIAILMAYAARGIHLHHEERLCLANYLNITG